VNEKYTVGMASMDLVVETHTLPALLDLRANKNGEEIFLVHLLLHLNKIK
jgi:hypothetical protein